MSTCRSAWPGAGWPRQDSGIHHVRGALPARLPGTGAGSTGFKEIIYFLAQLDVKEIHGYNPDLGLSVFTQAALARMEAARNAVATVGAALPAFEVPRDASALNGTVNGDSVLQGVAEDA